MGVFDRIMVNLAWAGWIITGVKVWATVAAWITPQMFFVY